MIGIKSGTQTYSTAEQANSLPQSGDRRVSATEQEKMLGGQEVGEMLNKLSDPNWVDPSKKMRTAGDPELDKDAFLKLLLTQLKHQDPTNPLKSHEMAAQLAQFTSLEKLTNIDDSIGSLAKAQEPAANYDALNLIGKAVSGDSSKLTRIGTDEVHSLRFDLAGDAQKAIVEIVNDKGEIVRELQYTGLKKGKNELNWNGQLENGTAARPGEYKVKIEATASNGNKIFANTKFEGKITGVNFTRQGPVLLIGNQAVRMSDIDKIVDPTQLSKEDVNRLIESEVVPAAANEGQSQLGDLKMSREMMNKVNKVGAKAGI